MLSYSLEKGRGAVWFKPTMVSDLDKIAQVVTQHTWSPAHYLRGYRKKENFIAARLCVLDFDDGQTTLDEAVDNLFPDYIHIIGTTKSHQIKKSGVVCDRFRVILWFDELIQERFQYEENLKLVYGEYTVDPTTKEAGRMYYPCREIVSVNRDGYTLPVNQVANPLSQRKVSGHNPIPNLGKKPLPGYVLRELRERVWIKGKERNNKCFGVSKDLARAGYNEQEAYQLILRSPTYRNMSAGEIPHDEIKLCVRNGFKAEIRSRRQQPPRPTEKGN